MDAEVPAGPWDPLEGVREPGQPDLDVFLSGQLFFDIVFTGLAADPAPGTEVWTTGMGSLPGGIANLAVAASRLGLRTGLAAGFGDDVYGRFCWDVLSRQEGVDLDRSRSFAGWHSPVTVSLAHHGDRSMITHGHPLPVTVEEFIGTPPPSQAVIAELAGAGGGECTGEQCWWLDAAAHGSRVFADVGWDPTGTWDRAVLDRLEHCYAFLPNQVEAMAYTRTRTPEEALRRLADRVPVAVVTRGELGAIAVDSESGEEASVPALAVSAVDATGAGDVFGASFVLGTLARWPLEERLAFSALCASLAVQQFGGSLAAPGWGDIADWWRALSQRARTGEPAAVDLARRYGFLADRLPACPIRAVRRAEATFALASDL